MKIKALIAITSLIINTTNLNAQKHQTTQSDSTKTELSDKIKEIVVLGNHQQIDLLKEPFKEQLSLMPTITQISAKEIKRQGAETLMEAMKYTPSAWIETRGRKVKQFFSIRGQKYPYPSYSINGIWQNEFHEMPYFFNSSTIEKISIIRSSSALLKSLSGLTGVIDITTHKALKAENNIYAKYGTRNSYHMGVSHGNKIKNLDYFFSINSTGTDGIKNRNGNEKIWNFSASLNWEINKRFNWSFNLFYLKGKRELEQPVAPASQKFRMQEERYDPYESLMISSKLKYYINKKFTSELQLNFAQRIPNYIRISKNKTTEYQEKDYEFTLNETNTWAINKLNTLRFGFLYNFWEAPNGKRFYYGKRAAIHTLSGVITDQHNFGKLLLDCGFRLTRKYYIKWGGFNIEGSGKHFGKVSPIENEWQKPEWQATGGLTYTISPKSSIHSSIASGIITPRKSALNESGERLRNETRINIDLGYEFIFKRNGKLTITAFCVNRKDAIALNGKTFDDQKGNIIELYSNNDRRNYGIETSFQSPLLMNSWSIFSNFTYMKGEIKREKWMSDDEMPNYIANLGVNFNKKGFDANLYLHYTSKYKNDRFVDKKHLKEYGKAPLGDFTTLDITGGYTLGVKYRTRVFVEGKNILNKKYQTVPGYTNQGRTLSIGANLKF